jgi:hypothetical protein
MADTLFLMHTFTSAQGFLHSIQKILKTIITNAKFHGQRLVCSSAGAADKCTETLFKLNLVATSGTLGYLHMLY